MTTKTDTNMIDPDRLRALEAVARLARAARGAQREYFRCRGSRELVASKRAEADLDRALAALREIEEGLPLFAASAGRGDEP